VDRPDRCPQPTCRSVAKVIDTRPRQGAIRRRRECVVCGERWSTYEIPITRKTIAGLSSVGIDLDSNELLTYHLPRV